MEKRSPIEDPVLAEIVEEGDLRIFPITGALEDFERMLSSQSPNKKLLEHAWRQFATYDANAVRLQNAFKNIQFWILVIGLIAIFLVVFEKQGVELVKNQQVKALSAAQKPAHACGRPLPRTSLSLLKGQSLIKASRTHWAGYVIRS